MAIQFHCPYCTASIRVPDAAAGKRGTCPKCATKLIVPNVEPPPVAKPVPAAPAGNPSPEAKPGPPPVPVSAPLGFPEIQIDAPIVAQAPPMAQIARRRAKRKGTNPLVPILLFCVVMGLVGYWMLKPGVTITGELSAQMVPGFEVPKALIDKSTFPLASAKGGASWEELIKHPPSAVRVPDAFFMEFEPSEKGVEVVIQTVANLDVFRVRTNSLLRQFVELHVDEISRQQQAEFKEALPKFVADWQTSQQNDLPFQTTAYYDTVGFNRLTGPMGYCVVAQIGDKSYRCVHEDPEGHLYFLLPQGTEQFVLQGRKLPDGKTLFESRLTVKVGPPVTDQTQKESAEPKTTPDPMMETEMRGEPESATQ